MAAGIEPRVRIERIERTDLGGWRQIRRWHDGCRDTLIADGPNDRSPAHNGLTAHLGGLYDPDCSACWLGYGHTAQRHASNIAA